MRYLYIPLLLVTLLVGSRFIREFSSALAEHQSKSAWPTESPVHSPADTSAGVGIRDELSPAIAARLEELSRESESMGTDSQPAVNVQSANLTADRFPPLLNESDLPVSPQPDFIGHPKRPSSAPIRHPGESHPEMITPANFQYEGAFRPPHFDEADSPFSYGGWAMAFHEHGDAGGDTDGYSGSLLLTGHRQKDLVAEISIPRPRVSHMSSMDELPVASVLQPLSDITAGIRDFMTQGSSEPFQLGGLCVVDNRLHWTLYKFYNVQTIDYPSHGVSSLSFSDPRPEGLWHLGPSNTGRSEWHSYKHAGYIFEIPQDQAEQWWFRGRSLISGLQIATGLNIASHGPAMFAYSLPEGNAAGNHDLDALPLVYNDIARPAPDFVPSDRWTGGSWLTLNDKHTVIIAGRKSLGESYYGEARPQDCSDDKGFHGAPYEAQIRFYAPQSLAASAAKKADPTAIQPWYVWDHNSPGGGFNQYLFQTCSQMLGGLAYDRKNNLLYVAQIDAGTTHDQPYELLPVIHVFRIVP